MCFNHIRSSQVLMILWMILFAKTTVEGSNILGLKPVSPCSPVVLSKDFESKHLPEKELFMAIVNEDHEATQRLLENGANANAVFTIYDSIQFQDEDRNAYVNPEINPNVVLLSKPENEDLTTFFEDNNILFTATALHLAVKQGYVPTVHLLLKAGAKTDAKIPNGLTAFAMLAYQKHIGSFASQSMTQLFIDNDPKPEDQEIVEAYHHAALAKNISMALTLVRHARSSLSEDMLYPRNFNFIELFGYSSPEEEAYRWMHRRLVHRGIINSDPSS